MSDLTALAVILGFCIAGHVSITWTVLRAWELRDAVATGTARGVRVSIDRRRLWLFNSVLPMFAFAGFYALIFAIGLGLFARSVGNEYVRMFGYLGAGQAAFGSLMIFSLGSLEILFLHSELRQAEAETQG